MRRIVLWGMGTVSVVALLFGYRTSTEGVSSTPAALPVVAGTTGRPSSGPAAAASSAATATAPATSTRHKKKQRKTQVSTVLGDSVETQYGPVQVKLTVSGGRITAVAVPMYPDQSGMDVQIASFALPQLVQETISAQSAKIDMISGATYTSEGYLQSLQSALDKAGLAS